MEVINSLGLSKAAMKDTQAMYKKLETGTLDAADLDTTCKLPASDKTYADNVCHIDHQVSRFNADTKGPAPNRCEGKVLILASIHDTFPTPKKVWLRH